MTLFTPSVLKWLQDNMSCRRFARHVSAETEPLGGPYRWFHFWLHWAVCPFCRRYWEEIRALGAAQRALPRHPASQLRDIKSRLVEKLKRRFH
jgi:hypothetical protein